MNILQEWTCSALISLRWRREEGQDMVEYALLVGLLSVFALAIIILVGPAVKSTFQYIVNGLEIA